jgi:hypothetical protein
MSEYKMDLVQSRSERPNWQFQERIEVWGQTQRFPIAAGEATIPFISATMEV